MTDRPPPPELEFTTPLCPICLDPTEFNDGFDCNTCGAHWPECGNNVGEWHNPEAGQCTSVIAPWRDDPEHPKLADHEFRCYLAEKHEQKKHTNPEYVPDWLDTDKDAYRLKAVTTPAADRG